MLVEHLPREAATVQAQREESRWGDAEYLLAAIVDLLQGANWQRGNAGVKHPSAKPKPIPRPGERRKSAGTRYGGGVPSENVREILTSFDPVEE